MGFFGKTVNIVLTPVRWSCYLVVAPIIMGLYFVQGLIYDAPKYVECIEYKMNKNNDYVKYDDIPDKIKPDYLHYNSYKDKIAIIVDDKICFAHKYIDKKTNQIVYVYIANNGETVIEKDIEQYKIS